MQKLTHRALHALALVTPVLFLVVETAGRSHGG
jgi:hypothetical protein